MDDNTKTAVSPELKSMGTAGNAAADATRRIAARKAYRARIESLLDESRDERLADVWQRVYPFPVEPAGALPDRRGMIEDLVDFVETLQPSLGNVTADQLCRLIEKYGPFHKYCNTAIDGR
jgi:hypothetical protein